MREGMPLLADEREIRILSEHADYVIGKIALDGCCRTGKGVLINSLYGYFTSRGVPTMVLKGDGTRLGAGEAWHDLGSRYWTYRHDYHGGLQTPRTEWDIDAYTLARENRVWLRALGDIAMISRSRFAVALFDRSIISRATLAMQREGVREGRLTEDQMWPLHIQIPGQEITYAETQPDILFNVVAPQDILEDRIPEGDYDRLFRNRAIYEYYDDFMRAKDMLPIDTKTVIIDIDGEVPIPENTEVILKHLGAMFPEIEQIRCVQPMYESYSS